MQRDEIYQSVTDTIIKHLESNLEGWRKPWINVDHDDGPARNPSQKNRPYKGINQLILSMSMMMPGKDFLKNQWMTYKQALSMNAQVRKGEKSLPITWYSTKYIDKNKKYHSAARVKSMSGAQRAEIGLQTIPMLRLYNVFNVAQIEGLDPSYYEPSEKPELRDFEKDDRAEAVIRATGVKIEEVAGDRAYYNIERDTIRLPLRNQFQGVADAWYNTATHELAHATGHPSRLNRDLKNVFGSAAYAHEELVAELASAMVCANLGFSKMTTNSAAYLKNWLGVLKDDNKAIFKAAAHAQRAADFILDKSDFKPVGYTPQPGAEG